MWEPCRVELERDRQEQRHRQRGAEPGKDPQPTKRPQDHADPGVRQVPGLEAPLARPCPSAEKVSFFMVQPSRAVARAGRPAARARARWREEQVHARATSASADRHRLGRRRAGRSRARCATKSHERARCTKPRADLQEQRSGPASAARTRPTRATRGCRGPAASCGGAGRRKFGPTPERRRWRARCPRSADDQSRDQLHRRLTGPTPTAGDAWRLALRIAPRCAAAISEQRDADARTGCCQRGPWAWVRASLT